MDGMGKDRPGETGNQSPVQDAESPGSTEETSLEGTQSDMAEKEEAASGNKLEEAKTVKEAVEMERHEEIKKEEEEGEGDGEGLAANGATEEKEEETEGARAELQEGQEAEEVTEEKDDAPDTTEEAGSTSGECSVAEKETEEELEKTIKDDKPVESSQNSHEKVAGSTTETDTDAKGKLASLDSSSRGTEAKEQDAPSAESGRAASTEQKKSLERRRDIARSRTVPKSYGAQSQKAIMEKFGGPASGTSPGFKMQRPTTGASGVKNMLLEWCRAKTRGYEHVDIQNFSSSWSSGMAFCALVHKFFPDSFDYESLDPNNRKHNFELAFSAAEKHADCAPLLEADDMVRMSVPDSKCVYIYVQELYRSLVQKGLVKTKKQ